MPEWIDAAATGHFFFQAFPVCLLLLFILLPGRRVRFLIPGVILTLVIVNPVFYNYWDSLGLYAYWRILWIVPVIPTLAAFIPAVSEKIDNTIPDGSPNALNCSSNRNIGKILITVAGAVAIALGGTYVYTTARGQFDLSMGNAAKLPDPIAEIADRLTELGGGEDHKIRVIAEDPIGVYIRQYTGEIDTLYGRNIDGYIFRSSATAKDIHNQISNNEFEAVSTIMLNDDYDYLVVNDQTEDRKEKLKANGFELADTVGDYGIYSAQGTRTLRKIRNDLGQVTSVTIIDADGNAVNGDDGYSRISYEYNSNGLITRAFRTDTEGNGIADSNGKAGYEHVYDAKGHVLIDRSLGPDGTPAANAAGYAEVRREYRNNYPVRDEYLNTEGQPVNRIDTLYAMVTYERDKYGNAVRESYWAADGTAVNNSNGYAYVTREYERKDGRSLLVKEQYYDTDHQPVMTAEGYAD